MYMYLCMDICIYLRIHVYIYTHIHVDVNVNVDVDIHVDAEQIKSLSADSTEDKEYFSVVLNGLCATDHNQFFSIFQTTVNQVRLITN